MTASIRADLSLGTAYGLAVSAIVWTVVLAPPPLHASSMHLLAFGAVAGALGSGIRRRTGVSPTYTVALAALLLSGPAISCLAGLLCTLTDRIVQSPARVRRTVSHLAFRSSRTALACVVASAVYLVLGGEPAVALARQGWIAVAGHLLAYQAVRSGLTRLTLFALGRGTTLRQVRRRVLSGTSVAAAGALAGYGLAWLYTVGELGSLGLVAVAGIAVWLAHRLRTERRRLVRDHAASLARIEQGITRGLARTMEARDPGTQSHLRRVQHLCLEIGERLNMTDPERTALASGALLHDIGKLAVPEGILFKPGRLTETEMDRVRAHPTVGAEILQSIPCYRALVPIVRFHHERWDGSGYPDGLKGDRIPLAARILSVVDCYDALTSDRPYRKALSHDEAIAFLQNESGHMFDPVIVETLLEHLGTFEIPDFDVVPRVEATDDLDHGEECAGAGGLATAQRELEILYDISRAQGYGLHLDEFLTLAACSLSSLVPYQSIVVYFLEKEQPLLRAGFALGRAADKLRLMTIPLGERVSGWAALQRCAVVGRDHLTPLDRDGSRSDLEDWSSDREMSTLKSTIAAPIVAEAGLVGVVTLYDELDREFTADERRILVRIAGYIAQVATHEERQAGSDRTSLTDPLTGVPNARFLWLESAHRMGQPSGPGFGLVALRIGGLERINQKGGNQAVDRALCEIARRLASGCRGDETLVRFGQDMFVVLAREHEPGELVRRWHEMCAEIERPLVDPRDGEVHRVRPTGAHASYPADGDKLDSLMQVLDTRLRFAARPGRTVLPFRLPRTAGGESVS